MKGFRRENVRRLLHLAWPVFIGQLAVIGFSTVDTLLVARSSSEDLAALSVGSAAYITVFVGLMGVVLALGPIVGQLFGAGRYPQAGRELHQAAWVSAALSVAGALLLLFPTPFLALARAPLEVEERIRGYLIALAAALPAALLVQAYRGFNNAISRPRAVMALQVAGLVLKIPLSALLVFGAPSLGVPALGVLGCGISTAVIMWLQALVCWLVLTRDPHYRRFELTGRGLDAPDRSAIGGQLRLGLPIGLSIMVEVSGFTLMAIFIARLGVVPSAGHQIAANLTAMMFMMPLALSSAAMTLVAQRIGAGDQADARRLGWHGLQLAVGLAAALGALLWWTRSSVAALYTTDVQVLAVAVPLLAWVAVFHVFDAAQAVASFVLRAFRIATAPMLIYAGSLWGLGLGGGYVLAFDTTGQVPGALRGPVGYWAAAAAGLAVAAGALVWLMARTLRSPGVTPTPTPTPTPSIAIDTRPAADATSTTH